MKNGRRIILFGATGYTGRMVARALVTAGARPALAGRSVVDLKRLAGELECDLDVVEADAARPETVGQLVARGDVLVSTVGPFVRWGAAAAQAAIDAGAWYIDSTGEAPFIRQVFERYGPLARAAGTGLLTAFGYDWVPGHVAAELALRRAGEPVAGIELGYFVPGEASFQVSGGTRASAAASSLAPTYTWHNGRLVTERAGRRARKFEVDGKRLIAMSVGSTEQFSLPRLHPELQSVDTYLGWFGPATHGLRAVSLITAGLTKLPLARRALTSLVRSSGPSGEGPDEATRARTRSYVVAIARSPSGQSLSQVALQGVNPYDFTAKLMGWGARWASEKGMDASGALGPLEAFGLNPLLEGLRHSGLEIV